MVATGEAFSASAAAVAAAIRSSIGGVACTTGWLGVNCVAGAEASGAVGAVIVDAGGAVAGMGATAGAASGTMTGAVGGAAGTSTV